jgi:radical SAM protein with 4Fe4S-binding SPASM domain
VFGIKDKDVRAGLQEKMVKRSLVNVLSGISRYGVTRPQILNAPFLVVWDFTHRCNLRCAHCYQDAQRALPGELSMEEALGVIDQLEEAGVGAIAFAGGEPLMRRDFYEVAAYASAHGFYVALATNGTLITQSVAERLKASGVEYVEISIDGKDAESHDDMRGIPGAFNRSVEGLRRCAEAGLYTCVATTVTSRNIDQVADIHRLTGELGARQLMCFNFIPTGRGADMVDQDITPVQREALMQQILAMDMNGKSPVALSTAPQFGRISVAGDEEMVSAGHFYIGSELGSKARVLSDFIGGCGAGRLYCSIEPTGDVQPCVFLPVVVGNLRESTFSEVWHGSPVLQSLRDRSDLKGSCGTCENRFICGGCRARAWAYYRDLKAPDPGCVNNAAYWEALVRERRTALSPLPLHECPGCDALPIGDAPVPQGIAVVQHRF